MQQNTQQFEFHGKTGEFFKIWIVNIMLSIVTLGIYSAWAKVRTRQYFYNNTLLLNTSFDYLADPVKILKGRLLAFAVLLIYSVSSAISPMIYGFLLLLFIPLLPWIIIKALKFNLFNSAYRNIRFNFKGVYLKALWVFIGLPIIVAISFGLAYPYFTRERKKFIIDNSAYGTSEFEMTATASQFYSIYIKAVGVMLLIVLFVGLSFYVLQSFFSDQDGISGFSVIMVMLLYPFGMIAYGYIYTTVSNLVFNHTSLKQCQFSSCLETTKICWLYFSNTLLIIFSLGLFIPWAMIRTARYKVSCLSLITDSDPDAFIAAETEKASAIGEELGDLLDIDVGL